MLKIRLSLPISLLCLITLLPACGGGSNPTSLSSVPDTTSLSDQDNAALNVEESLTAQATLTTLFRFPSDQTQGFFPDAELLKASDGNFYGTASSGGAINDPDCVGGCGVVFRLTPAGTYTRLFSFGGTNGSRPKGKLIETADGFLFGTTEVGGLGGGVIFKIRKNGTGFAKLFQFKFPTGASPQSGLTRGTDGNLYGVASDGGSSNQGVFYRFNPNTNVYTPLLQFSGSQGSRPFGELTLGSDGNFYGTTISGGSQNRGVVFRVTPTGGYKNLQNFNGTNNGSTPIGGVIPNADGTEFFGTTFEGGSNNFGVIYKIKSDGTYTKLFNFNGTNGRGPQGELLRDSSGSLYGTATFGGTTDRGVIFKFVPTTKVYTRLFNFAGGLEGSNPSTGLTFDMGGTLFGPARSGGFNGGTLFKLVP